MKRRRMRITGLVEYKQENPDFWKLLGYIESGCYSTAQSLLLTNDPIMFNKSRDNWMLARLYIVAVSIRNYYTLGEQEIKRVSSYVGSLVDLNTTPELRWITPVARLLQNRLDELNGLTPSYLETKLARPKRGEPLLKLANI